MYPISVSDFPEPEGGVFCVFIVDLISRSVLVGFSLLRASNYNYRKRCVCYVLPYYSQFPYGELSILLLFILSRDTLVYVCLLLLYIDL